MQLAPRSTRLWWRDAVTYQIYIRSFADSNGDGIGDINGIRSRLPYLKELGIDAIWITPWFPSPQKDHGYDVANYFDIEPDYGTLGDAKALIAEAHEIGIRILLDIVPNHCSDQHEWFQTALKAAPGSKERDRFHFLDGRGKDGELPPNNWPSVFGGNAWQRVIEADGKPGGGPQRVGVPVADMFTGFAATVSILAALRHRDQTGEGQYCEVSLYETMVSLMQAPMTSWLNAGKLMQRTGNDAVVAVPYGVFQGSDAKFVIGVLNDREFVRLSAALGHPEWAEDERFRRARDRAANRDLLLGMMHDVLCKRPRAEWLAVLEEAKITSGPINTAADVEVDPHTKARGLIVEVPHHAGGQVRVPASPLRLAATPVAYRYGIPAPGEHTDAVLREFADMTEEEIATARAAGVL